MFTHALLQLVKPESQSTLQVPPLQTGVARGPVPQTLLHLPQLSRSRLGSTQMPWQSMNPRWQLKPHLPAAQVAEALLGGSHSASHPPQFEVSFLVSTQEPWQFTVPLPQSITHWPPAHTCPAAQRAPHFPQLSRLELVSTQALPHCV